MDREIPKDEQKKARIKRWITRGGVVLALLLLIIYLISYFRSGIERSELLLSAADRGSVEVSVSASGEIVPAFEEIINSPIDSRIIELYKHNGDSISKDDPILKLDLKNIETAYYKLLDEEKMKRYKLEQLKVNNSTKLSDMQMQIKISAMKLDRMKVELSNEKYLDSLGAGTTDKVREVELSYKVSQLELEQLQQQYINEQEVSEAELKVQTLDFNIFSKELAEMKRTLLQAQVRAPRKAILTYVNNQIGARVAKGEQLAIISDLSHFKVKAEIADSYADWVKPGARAVVKMGSLKLQGVVSSVTPLSKNGVIDFWIQLKEDHHKRLRSGLKTDVYILNSVKEDVIRIANGSYYVGRGDYELFVKHNNSKLVKQKVKLGDSNFEYVEVISGLNVGDEVVVNDMSEYKNKNKLKIE